MEGILALQCRNFFRRRKPVGIRNLFPRAPSRKAGSCRWEISPPLSWYIIGWILNTKQLSPLPYLDSNLWLLCLARSMKTSEKYCATFTASLDVIKMNNESHLILKLVFLVYFRWGIPGYFGAHSNMFFSGWNFIATGRIILKLILSFLSTIFKNIKLPLYSFYKRNSARKLFFSEI